VWHNIFITNIKIKTKRIDKQKKISLRKKKKKEQDLKVHRSGEHNKQDRRIQNGEMGAGYTANAEYSKPLITCLMDGYDQLWLRISDG